MQALLLVMELQLDPPPPLGDARGEARWGSEARQGPALCPLANLVLLPPPRLAAARAAGALNAALGRPSTGRVDSALRCVATRDLPAGSLVLADEPGAPLSSAAATPPRLVRPATRCVCLLCPSSRVYAIKHMRET